jgi:hypothetical protein
MSENPIARKLGIKPQMRALVVAAPAPYLQLLEPLPEGAIVSSSAQGSYLFIQFFATSLAEVRRSDPNLLKHAARGALLWIAYPKKTLGVESDLSRDVVAEAMRGTGWRPVSIVAIDEVWSALRFRPVGDVKTKPKTAPVAAR